MGERPNPPIGRRDPASSEKRTGEHGGDPSNKDAPERQLPIERGPHQVKKLRHLHNIFFLGALVLTVCFADIAGGDEMAVVVSRPAPPSVHLDIKNTSPSVPYDIYRSFQINTVQWDLLGTVSGNGGTVPYDDTTGPANQKTAFYRIFSSATPTPTPTATPTPTPTPTPVPLVNR